MPWAPIEELSGVLPELGNVISTYRTGRIEILFRYVFASIFFVIGAFFLFMAAAALVIRNERTTIGMIVFCCVLGLPIFFGSFWFFYDTRSKGANRTLLFDKGFVNIERSRFLAVPWNEIETVWQAVTGVYFNGIYTGAIRKYTVQTSDGTRIVFDDQIRKVAGLGDAIQKAVTPRLLAGAWDALEAGNSVSFGNLSVSPGGMQQGGDFLPWKDVSGIQVQNGVISVRKEGKWFAWTKIKAEDVPNLFVFLSVVEKLASSKGHP